MDSRALVRGDIGFYTRIRLWPLLKSLCRIHVALAYQTILHGAHIAPALAALHLSSPPLLRGAGDLASSYKHGPGSTPIMIQPRGLSPLVIGYLPSR